MIKPRDRSLRRAFSTTAMVVSSAYALALLAWYATNRLCAGGPWWLSLVSAFAPLLFLPLLAFVALAFLVRRPLMWASVVVPIALFLCLYGRQFVPRRPAQPGGPAMSILTFNAWGNATDHEAVADTVRTADADLIVLQEVNPVTRAALARTLVDLYPHQVYQPLSRAWGLFVLSRYPMVLASPELAARTANSVLALEVRAPECASALYAVHLPSPNVPVLVDAGWQVDESVQAILARRNTIVRHLLDDLDRHSLPVLVAGDLNGTDQSQPYLALAARLDDAHRSVGRGFGHTFPAYAGTWRHIPIQRRLMRIDMVLYSESFTALDATTLPVHAESDHLPVKAVLSCASP